MDGNLTLEERVARLEALVLKEGRTDVSLRELLSAWPGGRVKLARRIQYAPAGVHEFVHAGHAHFPAIMAAKIANAFQAKGVNIFGKVTIDRLHQMWLREKARTKEVSDD